MSEFDEYLQGIPLETLTEAASITAEARRVIGDMVDSQVFVNALYAMGPTVLAAYTARTLYAQLDADGLSNEDHNIAYSIAGTYAVCAVMLAEERLRRE